MENPAIIVVVGLIVAALVYFVFLKKKALPETTSTTAKDTARPERKEPEPVQREPKKESPAPEKAAPEKAAPVSTKKPAPPESLPSTDVVPSESEPEIPAEEEAPAPSKKDVSELRKGLAASRTGFFSKLKALFSGKKEIDPAILEEMEAVLLGADVGVKTTQSILERLRDKLSKNELADEDALWRALRVEASRILSVPSPKGSTGTPHVILMVGVNGVGKTTTIGKLATKWHGDGKKVVLAAGDTFRAAAVQQLEVWGKRVGADVIKGKDGADPGAVAFEATTKAQEAKADYLLVDTAGRLHTKSPLMDEIKKVKRTIGKAMEGAPHETWLVLDATTGQNGLTQAAMFKEALDLSGVVLTKLDGTAKGGIVLAVCDELNVPVRYIGLGERAEDLREFNTVDFVEALLGRDADEAEAA